MNTKNNISKKILLAVAAGMAAGGLTIALAVAPGLGHALKPFAQWYGSENRRNRYRIRKTFARLRRERLIEMSESPTGELKVVLLEGGQNRVLQYKLDELRIEPAKKWDKKWRMVIFDIPESMKKARNALREKLQNLGFHQIQKSVWVYPYECKNEIDFVAEIFDVSPYVRMAEALRFDGEEEIKRKFGLT